MDWVVVVGGFCTPKAAYAAEMFEIKSSGRKVLFVKYDEDIKLELEARGIEKADFVVYSYNGILLRFAENHPEMIRRLILVNLAGLIGEDTTVNLVLRFSRQMVEEAYAIFCATFLNPLILLTTAKVVWGFVWSLLWNFRQIPDIASLDIVPLLAILKWHEKEIFVLNAYSDRVFPEERIAKVLGEDPIKLIAGWAMFKNKGASHNASYIEKPGILRQLLGW